MEETAFLLMEPRNLGLENTWVHLCGVTTRGWWEMSRRGGHEPKYSTRQGVESPKFPTFQPGFRRNKEWQSEGVGAPHPFNS